MKARLLSETAIHYYRRTHKPLNSFIEDTYRMAYIILAHKQFEITLTHKWNRFFVKNRKFRRFDFSISMYYRKISTIASTKNNCQEERKLHFRDVANFFPQKKVQKEGEK